MGTPVQVGSAWISAWMSGLCRQECKSVLQDVFVAERIFQGIVETECWTW